ncbi:MAG: hypothetical protein S0880_10325 [Actinomycetota bacterium]|nr:hypothetical protein [Actinomycetota bacterium]
MSNAAKAVVAALIAALQTLGAVIADNVITAEEWSTLGAAAVALVIGVLGAFGVYRVPNEPGDT